jgi:lipoyl(octanoyl) transferase
MDSTPLALSSEERAYRRAVGWRLILHGAHGAAENMAIDEAILRACADGSSPPTIRIYSWTRPSISLGCLQDVLRQAQDAQVSGGHGRFDLDYCRANGIEVVRRITGGRAVPHGCDVTFSIAIRESDMPAECRSVIASHRWLMGAIVAGLSVLGLDAELGPTNGRLRGPQSAIGDSPADCFAHTAECDVRVGRAKAVGSAQVRKLGALLEQGSIPYSAPAFDAARALGRPARNGCCPLEGFAFDTIAEAIVRGFASHLRTALERAAFTVYETDLARELAREKYATEAWTRRLSARTADPSPGS